MSVLIKGMTIPNTCEECNLESFCDKWIEARKMCGEWKLGAKATIRHPECPLVPVPPHGRLIDAEELKVKAIERSEKRGVRVNVLDKVITVYDIEGAPTVIPAEEGE